jgi:hypothetical protein
LLIDRCRPVVSTNAADLVSNQEEDTRWRLSHPGRIEPADHTATKDIPYVGEDLQTFWP